jgi:4-methyl-5(b-hydroxyethyl)-thiazole monophosphate biosynthesis
MVYIILGKGFEEIEAIAPYDVLKRGGVEVEFAGIGGNEVTGGHGVKVTAERRIEEIDAANADVIVVPGGLGGVDSIKNSPEAMAAIKTAYDAGKRAAAICAGPTVLSELGIMEGKHGVCYPGFEEKIKGAQMSQKESAVIDGRVITGRAAGAAVDFGLAILAELKGEAAAKKVADAICHEYK